MESASRSRDILLLACKLLLCTLYGAYVLAALGALLWSWLLWGWDTFGWTVVSPALCFLIMLPGAFMFVGTFLWALADLLLQDRSALSAVVVTFSAVLLSPIIIVLIIPGVIVASAFLLLVGSREPDHPLRAETTKLRGYCP